MDLVVLVAPLAPHDACPHPAVTPHTALWPKGGAGCEPRALPLPINKNVNFCKKPREGNSTAADL